LNGDPAAHTMTDMTSPFPSELKWLLACAPTVVDFPAGQGQQERERALGGLAPEARAAMLHVLERYVLAGFRVPEEFRALRCLMAACGSVPDDSPLAELCCSDDWRLRVFANESGTLYDFNGWPGDNEAGAGVFQRPGSCPLVDIFGNGDEDLVAVADEYYEVVRAYARRRRGAVCGYCGDAETDELVCERCISECCARCGGEACPCCGAPTAGMQLL